MDELDDMMKKMQEKTDAELAATSMIFWQAEITGFWKGDPHSVISAFFASKDNAHAWLLVQQANIAPLDQWSAEDEFNDPWFKDPKNDDEYEAGVYPQWTKD